MTEEEEYLLPDEKKLTSSKPFYDSEDFNFDESDAVTVEHDTHKELLYMGQSLSNSTGLRASIPHETLVNNENETSMMNIIRMSTKETISMNVDMDMLVPKIQLMSAIFSSTSIGKEESIKKISEIIISENNLTTVLRECIEQKLLTLI